MSMFPRLLLDVSTTPNSLRCSEVVHGFSRPCYDFPIRGDIDADMQVFDVCGGAVEDAAKLKGRSAFVSVVFTIIRLQ
jgi:hypothetical protein